MIIRDQELVEFLQWALPRLGRPWSGYRKVRGQVKARLKRRLEILGVESLDEYREYLEGRPDEWEALDDFCRITISRFYRGRAVFDRLREEVFPELARAAQEDGRTLIRAWCIGSASGEEAYTLRLCWDFDAGRRFPDLKFEIIGTDAGEVMIERARRGCYPKGSLKELPEEWKRRGFEKISGKEKLFCVREPFRQELSFHLQDIRREQPPGVFDLVLCRYVLFIYFEEKTQREVLPAIVDKMVEGAALVLGPKEELYEGAPFRPWFSSEKIFRLKSKA